MSVPPTPHDDGALLATTYWDRAINHQFSIAHHSIKASITRPFVPADHSMSSPRAEYPYQPMAGSSFAIDGHHPLAKSAYPAATYSSGNSPSHSHGHSDRRHGTESPLRTHTDTEIAEVDLKKRKVQVSLPRSRSFNTRRSG